jgi:hypothetical protein
MTAAMEPAIGARPPALLPQPALSEVARLALALAWLYPRLLLGLRRDLRRAIGGRPAGLGEAEQAAKRRRRFLTGAMLGYAASRYLYCGDRRGGARHVLNAEIYGLWGITIIALDRSVDAGQLGGEAAAVFLEQGLARMLRRPSGLGPAGPALAGAGPREPTGEAAAAGRQLAENLCELLGKKIELAEHRQRRRGVAEAELTAARDDFERRCRVLWCGELRSLEQVIVDPDHTWSWYYRQCLNQKTLEFALAPIALYCVTPTARRRFERLERAFLILNGGYAHTQLLDDIADLAGDTAHGLVTAPGYLLLSQGQLAERVLAAGDVDRAALHALAHASDLLVADLWPGPACHDRVGASAGSSGDDGAACAVRALANADAELSWPMQALVERRQRESAAYAGALGAGEADGAIRAVLESGVARRILGTVHDEQRTRRLRAELAAVEDHRLRSVLLLFDRLMARAYRRACRVAAAAP